MADNNKIAAEVLKAVGGKDNVNSLTHCMTRLRFTLVDESIPNDEAVKSLDGVLGVVHGGGQYQVVIGNNVGKVYAVLTENLGVKGDAAAAAPAKEEKMDCSPKAIGSKIMGYMAGCMTPMIPVLLAGGLMSTLNSVFGPGLLNLYSAESDLYVLFSFLYNAAFYFLPIMVGVNAAKQLNISPMLGGYVGCILMAPAFMEIAASGQPFTVMGIPCITGNYSQTVIPVMLSVAFFAFVFKLLKKYMPDLLTTVFTPFLSVLISTPVILCGLAPLGTIIGNAISGGLVWFGTHTGFLGLAVIAALWQFLVMTGMHMALMMPMMASFFETGIQSGPMLAGGFATWATFGVALGAAIRLKNKKEKADSMGFFVSGILGGVTEPTLYGLCFQYVRCFIPLMIGAFAGGAYAGLVHLEAYAITSPNFLALLSYAGGTTANLVNGIIASMISMVVACGLMVVMGVGEKKTKTESGAVNSQLELETEKA